MKKILLTVILIFACGCAVFSEEKALPTLEFAKQVGELIGQANLCGIDTSSVNQQLIMSITILAAYRKEKPDNAVNFYKSTINQQVSSPSLNCAQVGSDFEQVRQHLPKLENQK